jgi:hypothetical protein
MNYMRRMVHFLHSMHVLKINQLVVHNNSTFYDDHIKSVSKIMVDDI